MPSWRPPVLVALVAVAAAAPARAETPSAPSSQSSQSSPSSSSPTVRAAADAPRWRLRASLVQGFGGSRDGDATVARFPTTLELGARLFGPLSLALAVTGTVAGEYDTRCGQPTRPNAIAGALGLRADLGNTRSAAWVDPWVEVHGGVGAQAAVRELPGGCPSAVVFGTAGARAGFDAWLGRGAVTVAVAFDYLPVGSALAFVLGGSVILF